MSRLTAILLLLGAGVFLYLNLRPAGSEELFGLRPPDGLDHVTRGLFYRGWPLSPYMLCPFHGMKWHPEESFCGLALAFDALLAGLALAALAFASEWWVRRSSAPAGKGMMEQGGIGTPGESGR